MDITPKLATHASGTAKAVPPAHRKDAQQFMQYTILTNEQYQPLIDEVNAYIREGWEPLGGVSDYADFCAQAMIKPRPWIERNSQGDVIVPF